MPTAHPVCRAAELQPGGRKIIEAAGRSIGVFNVNGKFYALKNVCPHQLAPLCLGNITGTTLPSAVGEYKYAREGEIIRCPWHGWEFDITTGKSIVNPHKVRVATYKVTVEPANGGPPQECEIRSDQPDPAVETYDVTVEDGMVFLHL